MFSILHNINYSTNKTLKPCTIIYFASIYHCISQETKNYETYLKNSIDYYRRFFKAKTSFST